MAAVLSIWYGVNSRNTDDLENPLLPESKISTLPEDMKDALDSMTSRVKKTNSDRRLFSLIKKNEISADTPLVLQTYYTKSDIISEYVTSMPASLTGLTTNQLKSTLREWDIKEYKPDNALILRRRIEKLAPEDKDNQHIGIKNGRVVIYYGKKDREGKKIVKQRTTILVEDLPQSEIKKLRDGIDIRSEEELLTILEGLLSFKQD